MQRCFKCANKHVSCTYFYCGDHVSDVNTAKTNQTAAGAVRTTMEAITKYITILVVVLFHNKRGSIYSKERCAGKIICGDLGQNDYVIK